MDVEDVKKLTVEKLKPELKSRGLDTSGKKADLVERLEAYLKTNSTEPKEPAQPGPGSNAADAEDSKPAAAQARQSIVWSTSASTSAPADKTEAPDTTADGAKTTEDIEAEKRQARAAKFGTTGATVQETGKRKLDSSATDQISAEDLTSDDKQAKRRERFLTQEQKDAEAAKEEEAKKTQERISRFKSDDVKTDDVKPDDAKKADRSQRFQQWLGPNKTAPTAATANGKPKATGDKITAAVNSSLDQSAKLLGTGGKGKGASGKGASGKAASSKAPADVKFSDEFQAKADARKARFTTKG